jgi:Skp family chaperone for outer membrane proteins
MMFLIGNRVKSLVIKLSPLILLISLIIPKAEAQSLEAQLVNNSELFTLVAQLIGSRGTKATAEEVIGNKGVQKTVEEVYGHAGVQMTAEEYFNQYQSEISKAIPIQVPSRAPAGADLSKEIISALKELIKLNGNQLDANK